jgi:hypothetical protein
MSIHITLGLSPFAAHSGSRRRAGLTWCADGQGVIADRLPFGRGGALKPPLERDGPITLHLCPPAYLLASGIRPRTRFFHEY